MPIESEGNVVSLGVVAVVVSFNRRELLRQCLEAILAQTTPPDAVLVIDNDSHDGSAEVAREILGDEAVLVLDRNVGGAGGFAVGFAVALQRHDPEFVWVMDDDTVPSPTALAELVAGCTRDAAVVAASRVVWTDGSDHPMNTPRHRAVRRSDGSHALVVRSASFVSMLVSARQVRTRGLPIADYFIWNDDFEFSTRLLRGARGVYVPTSIVEHRTARLVATDDDPGERFYYEVRNKLWLFLRSGSLSAPEKLLYGASTLRRWARTFLRSSRRGILFSAARRGAWDGVRERPRHNATILDGLGEAASSVSALETRTAR